MPYDRHALSFNEYNIRKPPYAEGQPCAEGLLLRPGLERHRLLARTSWSTRRTIPTRARTTPGCARAAWGARPTSGAGWPCASPTTTSRPRATTATARTGRISYADLAPYYDKVDLYLGISGHPEGLAAPARQPLPAHDPAERGRGPAARVAEAERAACSRPYRAGVTTDGLKHNKYRSQCFGRGACNRRAGGCDIHAAFDSPTGLIYPAMDTGRLTLRTNAIVREVTVDPATGKARGVAFVDAETGRTFEAKAKAVVLGASTLESTRLLLLSRSPPHPNGLGNSSGHVGHNFCEHVMGPGIGGLVKDLVGKPRTLDDGRPGGFYVPRFRNLKDRQPGFLRGYGFEGSARHRDVSRTPPRLPGFGGLLEEERCATTSGAFIGMGGFGEVLPAYESYVDLDPEVKDRWGIPVLRFHYKFGDNEKKMCEDMAATGQRDVRGGGHRGAATPTRTSSPRAGRSTSWAPRAWAATPRRRC